MDLCIFFGIVLMIIYYDNIDSTNRIAKELALQGCASGTVVQAGRQESGRGQHGRTFSSPQGGLYFTLVLEPDLRPEQVSLVTLAVGLSCLEVIIRSFQLSPQIKWPNDIYLANRKLAGILCENFFITEDNKTKAKILVGVGMNVNNKVQDFPPELREIITTLYEWRKQQTDLHILLLSLVQSIQENISLLRNDQSQMLARWQKYDYLQGRFLFYKNATINLYGTGLGLAPDGRYSFIDEQGKEHVVIGGRFSPVNPT